MDLILILIEIWKYYILSIGSLELSHVNNSKHKSHTAHIKYIIRIHGSIWFDTYTKNPPPTVAMLCCSIIATMVGSSADERLRKPHLQLRLSSIRLHMIHLLVFPYQTEKHESCTQYVHVSHTWFITTGSLFASSPLLSKHITHL